MLMGEKKTFTCQNLSCKRTITTPLKTLNLQENPTELYYACPFCLTKIEKATLKNQESSAGKTLQKSQETEKYEKQKTSKNSETPSTCKFHLGYLSERGQKEQIPDDCLLCKNIVDCMLKRMREVL